MEIRVRQICGEDTISRAAGKKIRDMLENNWKQTDRFSIHFGGGQIASVSFFDEAFAFLLDQGHTVDELKRKLSFPDIHPDDRILLNYVLGQRLHPPR